ncbi:MAG: hypothetical protein KGM91_04480, partial [Burkholderiales bacterium]|nr:hypothetical protein [Burkholderiales bacterium]
TTAEASGASDGTVASMRRVREKLITMRMDPSEYGWHEARKLAGGEKLGEAIDWDTRTEEEAQEMANKLLGAFGKRAGRRVEAVARALEIYDSRLPMLLREFWGELDGEGVDAEEADL